VAFFEDAQAPGIARVFLTNTQLDRCLSAYARRTKKRGWWVSEKARLYAEAERAFAADPPDPEPFAEIYRTLRGYWQVFRNGRGWSPRKVLAVLTSPTCLACSNERLDLVRLGKTRQVEPVWRCLRAMSGVKRLPTGRISAMAASKFLHFFNPGLFPIYDRAVVANKAFPRFAAELHAARERWAEPLAPITFDPIYTNGLGTYVAYLLWAADTMASANHRKIMARFRVHFERMLRDEGRPAAVPDGLDRFYATAFEFAMIGALDVPGRRSTV
jgi:hypothetical protein